MEDFIDMLLFDLVKITRDFDNCFSYKPSFQGNMKGMKFLGSRFGLLIRFLLI